MSEIVAIDETVVAVESEADKRPKVHGHALEKMPEDLYIPPDALQVFLEAFEGPLDLLLYLIRRQNLNILDIPVLKITQQYLQYIALMQELRLELAAEYLLMAALLAEIKSRMLLPRPVELEEEQGDPRMELVRRLQEYERFKTAAEQLDKLPRMGRELHGASAKPEVIPVVAPMIMPNLRELMLAFRDVMMRAALFTRHQVSREPLSVRERMTRLLTLVQTGPKRFIELIDPEEGRAGVVVCLLAILELVKLSAIDLVQDGPFTEIMIDTGRPVSNAAIEEAVDD
jgi:segregation and condensation protein A